MSDDVLDLRPRIRRKLAETCDHRFISVGMDEASATCDDCDADLDPWWALRRYVKGCEELVAWREKIIASAERQVEETIANGNAAIAIQNATIVRLNGEVSELTERKNRLMNAKIDGMILSNYRKTRAREPR